MGEKVSLHAITLHRPWAWAIARAGKRVENRTWKPTVPVGSMIAIHAGKTWDADGATYIEQAFGITVPAEETHALGVVAVARLARVIDCSREDVPEDQEDWTVGPYAWLLDNVVALDVPVPCAGKQGLWPVEGALLASVRTAFTASTRKDGGK